MSEFLGKSMVEFATFIPQIGAAWKYPPLHGW
jgi:hypothetical protein